MVAAEEASKQALLQASELDPQLHKAGFQNIRGGAKWGWSVEVGMLDIQVSRIPDII